MKDYQKDEKIIPGPGGMHCNCCRNLKTVKDARVAINRRNRRKAKKLIKELI